MNNDEFKAADSRLQTRRRFLRFRLRTLLLLPVVFAIGWWWVMWPERTARRFVAHLNVGEVEAAKAMCEGPSAPDGLWMFASIDGVGFEPPIFTRSSWSDYATAQRSFTFRWTAGNGGGKIEGFFALRGRVAIEPVPPASGASTFALYYLRYVSEAYAADMLNVLFRGYLDTNIVLWSEQDAILVRAPAAIQSKIERVLDVVDRPKTPTTHDTYLQPIYRSSEELKKVLQPGL
jgi:hypothetical protein